MDSMDELKQAAQEFIRRLAAGDYDAAISRFDSNLRQAFPEARMKDTWLQILGQVGALQEIVACQAMELPDNRLVTVTCQFEKAAVDIRVAFDASGQMLGLSTLPAASRAPYQAPAYVRPQAFYETEVTVGGGEWPLPGTLSLPEGAGPFPAVVLVHGSGPQDRDETIGPNKPFRDLAEGLASQGVAVLRYEKRTKLQAGHLSAAQIARITVQEEVIDDALSAGQLLRQTPGIDPGRIYVLGHSLGATLAPRIGQQDPALAGLIIMAGMTRPFEDTILDQYTYLFHLSGALTDAQQAELEQLQLKVARVKDPSLSDQVAAKDLPLDLHPAYWLSLRGYRPAQAAQSLAMRLLVLQGARDYQVTAAGDFPAWQQALDGQPGATLKLYPRLSHLFIEGEGPSTPQDYLIPGHVSAQVVEDIARWIKR